MAFIPRIGTNWTEALTQLAEPTASRNQSLVAKELDEDKTLILIAVASEVAHRVFSNLIFLSLAVGSTFALLTIIVKKSLMGNDVFDYVHESAFLVREHIPILPSILFVAILIFSFFWPSPKIITGIAALSGIFTGLTYSNEVSRAVLVRRSEN